MKKASRKPVIIIATIAAFCALIIVLASCARSGTSPQSTSTVPNRNGKAELSITPEPQETPEVSEPPIIPGSELSLNVIDESTGLPVSNVTFIISIEYEPPLDGNNFSYTLFAAGESPYRIPITVPGSPSRAVITATKEGFFVSAELVIESEFYHERINPFREGGVSEFLAVVAHVDIKPGSNPNSINCNDENGVIAVAILTTEDFDATTVDHTKVIFEGASETQVDNKSGDPRRHEEDVDGDGDIDLVFHFRLGDTNLACDATEGTLIGETPEGVVIEGIDNVRMIDEGGGKS